ncbi:MAG: tRNA (adenosine(37)-N6)-dimethylallyltransferase MiaA [Aliifodinibius sp.]|nr:tRNA (adenosine(37)-N6)-dimethylallyltransferase MiaA [Fodinibius sp.]
MSNDKQHPPLIVILGPTAVGKTALSLSLAERFDGEIISVDSRLFYRGMNIGTAKPSPEDLKRVPHYLIDVANPDEVWSLGKFKRHALACIEEIHNRRRVPFLVGGTGQFIRAITQGWVVPELKPDEQLRNVLNRWVDDEIGPEGLYERLTMVDPVAAKKILPGNVRRTIRAFEVIFKTGKRFSELRKREPVPYRILQIGLNRPRDELDKRIMERVDRMMEQGFLEEVKVLLENGYDRNLPSMSALGYRQLSAHLTGEMTLTAAVEEIKKVTKKFYRRQMTWFKPNDPQITWFDMSDSTEDEVEKLIDQFVFGV